MIILQKYKMLIFFINYETIKNKIQILDKLQNSIKKLLYILNYIINLHNHFFNLFNIKYWHKVNCYHKNIYLC
jgi:hypothetical protein